MIVVIDFETGGVLPPNETLERYLINEEMNHPDNIHAKDDYSGIGMPRIPNYYNPPLWVAAIAYDREFLELETLDIKIKADISMCDRVALDICHYDHELWKAEALEPKAVAYLLKEFFQRHAIRMQHDKGPFKAARLMGYNVEFDIAHMRKLFEWKWCDAAFWAGRNTGYIDIMPWCQLYGIMIGKPFKSLRLEDVHLSLFDEIFPAHNPLEDCRATARIARNIMFTMRQAYEYASDPADG